MNTNKIIKYNLLIKKESKKVGIAWVENTQLRLSIIKDFYEVVEKMAKNIKTKGAFDNVNIASKADYIEITNTNELFIEALIEEMERFLKIQYVRSI